MRKAIEYILALWQNIASVLKGKPVVIRYLWPLLGVLVASRLLVLLSVLLLTTNLSLSYLSLLKPMTVGVNNSGRPTVVEARSPDGKHQPLVYTFAGCAPTTVEVAGLRLYELKPCLGAQQPRQVTLAPTPNIQVFYQEKKLSSLQFSELDFQGLAPVHNLSLHDLRLGERLVHNFYKSDARFYLSIARFGYFYNQRMTESGNFSNAAFYPLFPALGAALSALSGLSPELTLLILAQVFAVVSGLLLFQLALSVGSTPKEGFAAVVLYSVFPTSFFLSVPYTESLYNTLSILVFLGLRTKWRLLAAVLSTLTRSTGVVHAPVLMLQGNGTWWQRLGRALVASSGLLGFAGWLSLTVKEPLAFVHAQSAWKQPVRPGSWLQHLLDALLLGPVVRIVGWVERFGYGWKGVILNLAAVVLVLVTLVTCYQRLPRPLRLYTLLVLGLPYFTFASTKMEMLSFTRFILTAYPLFLVWGKLLCQYPRLLAGVAVLSSLMMVYLSRAFGADQFVG